MQLQSHATLQRPFKFPSTNSPKSTVGWVGTKRYRYSISNLGPAALPLLHCPITYSSQLRTGPGVYQGLRFILQCIATFISWAKDLTCVQNTQSLILPRIFCTLKLSGQHTMTGCLCCIPALLRLWKVASATSQSPLKPGL